MLYFGKYTYYTIVSTVLILINVVDENRACVTPDGLPGKCININRCRAVMTRLRNRTNLTEFFEKLKRSNCGHVGSIPLICCEINPNERKNAIQKPEKVTFSGHLKNPSVYAPPEIVKHHPSLQLLEHKMCGPIMPYKTTSGDETSMFEFPWMTLLAYDVVGSKDQQFLCGGTVINKRYVLTAAHCLAGLPKNVTLNSVRVGDYNLTTEIDCDLTFSGEKINCAEKYQTLGVEKTVVHPHFNTYDLQDNIALIRLNSTIDFRPHNVKPICLPLGNTVRTSLKAGIVIGWGTRKTGKRSDSLLQASLKIVSNEQCFGSYERRWMTVSHKNICACGKNNEDPCKGDSGGPLQSIAEYQDNLRMVQFGIISSSMLGCREKKNAPAAYTKIGYYLRWILDNLES